MEGSRRQPGRDEVPEVVLGQQTSHTLTAFPLTAGLLFPNYRPCPAPSSSAYELSAVCWFAVLFTAVLKKGPIG